MTVHLYSANRDNQIGVATAKGVLFFFFFLKKFI